MPLGIDLGTRSSFSSESSLAQIPFRMVKTHFEPIVSGLFRGVIPGRSFCSRIRNQDDRFASDLGCNTTTGFSISCNQTCAHSGREVSVTPSANITNGTIYGILINNVENPSSKGGTGNFEILSQFGSKILDINKYFGSIGVAGGIGTISTGQITLDPEGVQYAGELTNYILEFQTSVYVPLNSFARIYLPAGEFEVAQFPNCKAYPIAGRVVKGRLICEYVSTYHYIDVTGFTEALSTETKIGIIVALTNTRYAHNTGVFGVAFIRLKTQIIYDRKLDIPGVTITTGLIQSISMNLFDSALTITRNKILQFRLNFTPRNPLP